MPSSSRAPGSIWEGFAIVFGILAVLAVLAFAIASRLLKRGGPADPDDGDRRGQADPRDGGDQERGRRLMATPLRRRRSAPRSSRTASSLASSLERLRGEVAELMDWRDQIRRHQREVLIGAGIAGFVLGGGIAALGALAFGGRRRRQGGR